MSTLEFYPAKFGHNLVGDYTFYSILMQGIKKELCLQPLIHQRLTDFKTR